MLGDRDADWEGRFAERRLLLGRVAGREDFEGKDVDGIIVGSCTYFFFQYVYVWE